MFWGVTRRRVALLGVAALALAAFALPSNASASFATHFSVISEDVSERESGNTVVFRTVLYNPFNLSNRVGRSVFKCRFGEGRKFHCKGGIHLDGSIGGFGNLFVKGNLGRGDHTLNVHDGSGDFSGAVTGKIFIHNLNQPVNQIDFALTR